MSDLVLLGHIARAFGIVGGVVIKLINQESHNLSVGQKLSLKLPSGDERVVTIKDVKHGARVFFDDVNDRTQAELLKGASVWISRSAFSPLDEDEFYLIDLLSARVIDIQGHELGFVAGFSSNGPQILLEIKTTKGHIALVPAVKPIVVNIDYTAKEIILDAPHGLLDPLD